MNLRGTIGLALLLCSQTWANTITVTGLPANLGIQQSLYFDEGGVPNQAYWVGGVDISVNGIARLVFCVDLFTTIGFDTYTTAVDFSDTANLRRVGWLFQTQLPFVTTPTAGAGLQLAIWDIVQDNGDGLAPGAGQVAQSTDANHPTDASVLAAAMGFETISLGQSSAFGIVYHNATLLDGTRVQTLMGPSVNDGGPHPTVPEPAPIILMLSGFALIMAGKCRHSRAKRP